MHANFQGRALNLIPSVTPLLQETNRLAQGSRGKKVVREFIYSIMDDMASLQHVAQRVRSQKRGREGGR